MNLIRKYNSMLWSKLKYTIFLLFLIVLGINVGPVAAQEGEEGQAEPITMSVTAGFDSYYKGEFWVPVKVNVSNNGPAITGHLEIVVGSSTAQTDVAYSSPIELPTQSNKQLTTYVYLPHLTSTVAVTLIDEGGTAIAQSISNMLDRLSSEALLYGVVSNEANELAFLEDVDGGRGDAAVAFLDIEDLPEAAAAWNALDILIIHDVDSGQMTAAQLEALEGWISTGGQLVVSGGPAWQRTSAALAELLPVTITGSQSLDDIPNLRSRTGLPFRDEGPYLITTSSLRSGELLIHQDGLPILARQMNGRGRVYFLALDPNLAPLLDWDGSELIWGEVAVAAPRLPTWAVGAQNGYMASTAVSSLPELALPSTISLFLFLFIYVMAVGPVNYLVLKRMKRRELAWVTIPALVLVFSAISYLTGFQLKGNDPIVNEMSVAFGQADGEQMRVQSLIGLYSPKRETYDVQLPGSSMVRPFEQSSSGSLFGSGNLDAVQRANELTLSNVRVDVSDIETFVADSYRPNPGLTGAAVLRLNETDFEMEINVQNNSTIDFENVVLLLGSTVISFGDLAPGESDNHIQTLSLTEATAAAGASSGFSGGFSSSGPGSSPLTRNAEVILGTSDFYNDREIYPRWQLLQSLSPDIYSSTSGWYPSGVVTLVAWSDEEQTEIAVEDTDFERASTTLYFLEIPFTQTVASGQDIEVPKFLLNWQVLGENGIYNPSISELILPTGWIEFEYQPWPEFQAMTVKGLQVVLLNQNSSTTRNTPRIQVWDWSEAVWVTLDDGQWGRTVVADPLNYVGPGNAVRIRLQNDNAASLEIQDIYPLISGDL